MHFIYELAYIELEIYEKLDFIDPLNSGKFWTYLSSDDSNSFDVANFKKGKSYNVKCRYRPFLSKVRNYRKWSDWSEIVSLETGPKFYESYVADFYKILSVNPKNAELSTPLHLTIGWTTAIPNEDISKLPDSDQSILLIFQDCSNDNVLFRKKTKLENLNFQFPLSILDSKIKCIDVTLLEKKSHSLTVNFTEFDRDEKDLDLAPKVFYTKMYPGNAQGFEKSDKILSELKKFAEISPKILTTICEIDEIIGQKTDFQKVNHPCKKLQFDYLSENSETLIDDKILKAIKFNPCSTYLIRKSLVYEKLELAIMSIIWSFEQETFESSINNLEEDQNLLTVKNLPNDQVKLEFDSGFCQKNANYLDFSVDFLGDWSEPFDINCGTTIVRDTFLEIPKNEDYARYNLRASCKNTKTPTIFEKQNAKYNYKTTENSFKNIETSNFYYDKSEKRYNIKWNENSVTDPNLSHYRVMVSKIYFRRENEEPQDNEQSLTNNLNYQTLVDAQTQSNSYTLDENFRCGEHDDADAFEVEIQAFYRDGRHENNGNNRLRRSVVLPGPTKRILRTCHALHALNISMAILLFTSFLICVLTILLYTTYIKRKRIHSTVKQAIWPDLPKPTINLGENNKNNCSSNGSGSSDGSKSQFSSSTAYKSLATVETTVEEEEDDNDELLKIADLAHNSLSSRLASNDISSSNCNYPHSSQLKFLNNQRQANNNMIQQDLMKQIFPQSTPNKLIVHDSYVPNQVPIVNLLDYSKAEYREESLVTDSTYPRLVSSSASDGNYTADSESSNNNNHNKNHIPSSLQFIYDTDSISSKITSMAYPPKSMKMSSVGNFQYSSICSDPELASSNALSNFSDHEGSSSGYMSHGGANRELQKRLLETCPEVDEKVEELQ